MITTQGLQQHALSKNEETRQGEGRDGESEAYNKDGWDGK